MELLESLSGATPSVGFVHGMLTRAARLLVEVDNRIRTLIHETNLTRDVGRDMIDAAVRDKLIKQFTDGVLVRLSDTTGHGDRPGER
jgi:hypothetical protein